MGIDRPQRFFFYGTLLSGGPPRVREALARLIDLGPVAVPGMIYANPDPDGWYPVLVEGHGEVVGRLYEASAEFGPGDLAALDAYEDCDPADPANSLYLRIPVAVAGGTAQAYLFNQPLPVGARLIPHGDFAAWIAREGLPVFTAVRAQRRS